MPELQCVSLERELRNLLASLRDRPESITAALVENAASLELLLTRIGQSGQEQPARPLSMPVTRYQVECFDLPEELLSSLSMVAARLNVNLSKAAESVLRSHFDARDRALLTPHQLMGIQAEARSRGHQWTEQELAERGLPLYWSEDWLKGQLIRGFTCRNLAALYQYNARTLAQYAQKYGIRLHEYAGPRTYQKARELLDGGHSRGQIAAHLGFSEVTIAKATRGKITEKQRYTDAKLRQAGPYPATVTDVAKRVFEGHTDLARPWLYRMVKSGRLIRMARNQYMPAPRAQDDHAESANLVPSGEREQVGGT